MRKGSILLFCLAINLSFIGCVHHDINNPEPEVSFSRIIKFPKGIDAYTIFYYKNIQLEKYELLNRGIVQQSAIIEYDTNSIIKSENCTDFGSQYWKVHQYNVTSNTLRVDLETRISTVVFKTGHILYTFNDKKQMIKKEDFHTTEYSPYQHCEYQYDSKGNLKEEKFYLGSALKILIQREFDDKINPLYLIRNMYYDPSAYSKNNVLKAIRSEYKTPPLLEETNYTYEYNNRRYPISRIAEIKTELSVNSHTEYYEYETDLY